MVASVKQAIEEKLARAFAPAELVVVDESARHAGHAGARSRGPDHHGETHFRVRIVSGSFAGVSRVERQRRIYAALAEEIAGGVHALALSALAPGE